MWKLKDIKSVDKSLSLKQVRQDRLDVVQRNILWIGGIAHPLPHPLPLTHQGSCQQHSVSLYVQGCGPPSVQGFLSKRELGAELYFLEICSAVSEMKL